MKLMRTAACLAVSVMTAGGLAVVTHGSASATQHSAFHVVGPVQRVAAEKKVLGRTTFKGKGLLGVKVAAYKGTSTKPTASDLSYDYVGPEDVHHPGAFALRHLVKGTYRVVLKKQGFATRTITGVKVTGTKPVVHLGTIKMARPSASETKVKLSATSIKVGGKVTVTVKVAADKGTPTGKVQLLVDGKKLVKDVLVAKDKGRTTFVLKNLKKGTHKVEAAYAGDGAVKPSSSKVVKVTVKAAR